MSYANDSFGLFPSQRSVKPPSKNREEAGQVERYLNNPSELKYNLIMREFDENDFQTAGATYGEKIAKAAYKKFGADAAILGDLLHDASPESLIQADADEIIAEIGGMDSAQEKILKSICNAVNSAIIKDFPVIEDDFNFEDDFASEYGDSPANIYNIAFWNAFDNMLNRLQMQ